MVNLFSRRERFLRDCLWRNCINRVPSFDASKQIRFLLGGLDIETNIKQVVAPSYSFEVALVGCLASYTILLQDLGGFSFFIRFLFCCDVGCVSKCKCLQVGSSLSVSTVVCWFSSLRVLRVLRPCNPWAKASWKGDFSVNIFIHVWIKWRRKLLCVVASSLQCP